MASSSRFFPNEPDTESIRQPWNDKGEHGNPYFKSLNSIGVKIFHILFVHTYSNTPPTVLILLYDV
jgi:hypothetical protein